MRARPMCADRIWVLEAHEETRAMCSEFLRFDGYEVVSFECSEQFLAEDSEGPRVALVDAWTARSSEPAIVERIPSARVIVTTTSPALGDLWRRLGAARVYLKPISIDDVRADVHELADHAAQPASRTLPRRATDEEGEGVAPKRRQSFTRTR